MKCTNEHYRNKRRAETEDKIVKKALKIMGDTE